MSWDADKYDEVKSPQVDVGKELTKECINKASLLKNLLLPLFTKEGNIPSLWQREDRRDFTINVFNWYHYGNGIIVFQLTIGSILY